MQAPQAGDSTSLCEKGAKLEAASRGTTMTRITVWDGANCVGGNKILLQDRDLTLWLDFGQNLSHLMDYYEEFIKPQSRAGCTSCSSWACCRRCAASTRTLFADYLFDECSPP
jgi:hypothetical protein